MLLISLDKYFVTVFKCLSYTAFHCIYSFSMFSNITDKTMVSCFLDSQCMSVADEPVQRNAVKLQKNGWLRRLYLKATKQSRDR